MEGEPIRGQKALEITIELAIEAGELATKYLKLPHDLEYEKTFMPFLLLSKNDMLVCCMSWIHINAKKIDGDCIKASR